MPLSPAQSQRLVQHFSDLVCENNDVLPMKASSVVLSKLSPRRPLLTSSQSSDSVIVTSELFLGTSGLLK